MKAISMRTAREFDVDGFKKAFLAIRYKGQDPWGKVRWRVLRDYVVKDRGEPEPIVIILCIYNAISEREQRAVGVGGCCCEQTPRYLLFKWVPSSPSTGRQ